jgi:hypothetical protein
MCKTAGCQTMSYTASATQSAHSAVHPTCFGADSTDGSTASAVSTARLARAARLRRRRAASIAPAEIASRFFVS